MGNKLSSLSRKRSRASDRCRLKSKQREHDRPNNTDNGGPSAESAQHPSVRNSRPTCDAGGRSDECEAKPVLGAKRGSRLSRVLARLSQRAQRRNKATEELPSEEFVSAPSAQVQNVATASPVVASSANSKLTTSNPPTPVPKLDDFLKPRKATSSTSSNSTINLVASGSPELRDVIPQPSRRPHTIPTTTQRGCTASFNGACSLSHRHPSITTTPSTVTPRLRVVHGFQNVQCAIVHRRRGPTDSLYEDDYPNTLKMKLSTKSYTNKGGPAPPRNISKKWKKLLSKPAKVPTVNYKCDSNLLTRVTFSAISFQRHGGKISLSRKSHSWPFLNTDVQTDSINIKPKVASAAPSKPKGTTPIKPKVTTSSKTPLKPQKKKKRLRKLTHTRPGGVFSGLEDKVAPTSLHNDQVVDLESYDKLMQKQVKELVQIKTNLCSYCHVLEAVRGLEPEVVAEMRKAEMAWVEAHCTCVKKLKNHIDDWSALRDDSVESSDETLTRLEQHKRQMSTWLHSVLSSGRQLDKRIAGYILQEEVYSMSPRHRGCCNCRCDQTDGSCPSDHDPDFDIDVDYEEKHQPDTELPQRKKPTKMPPISAATSSSIPAFSVDGHYDDFHIHGVRGKRAKVDVCIRKKKRWQTVSEDDDARWRYREETADHKKKAKKTGDGGPAGRSKWYSKKIGNGNRNKKHKR